MDQIYSYEYKEHNPVDWWNSIPTNFKDTVHFINVGVSNNVTSDYSPIRLIKSLTVEPHDFVAFKLDIDTTNIEIPIFFQLLEDPNVYKIVDEFFFELHYNCPLVITKIHPVKAPPGYEDKIDLNRVGVLKSFSELRHKGVRAHFWYKINN